jgi:di/tricarboxylate transporter
MYVLEPGLHAIAAILVTIGAFVLFTRARISLEASCLIVLVALVAGFEVFPFTSDGKQFPGIRLLSGFGNEAVITIALLLVLAKGVEVCGGFVSIGRFLVTLWQWNASMALLATLVISAAASAFINNTPLVVMILPVLVGVAHHTGTPPSRILMPMGFATIAGGMTTTIGTSTNLLVVMIAADLGLGKIAMFDFFLPGAVAALLTILFMWQVAPRIIPDRKPRWSAKTPRQYLAAINVTSQGEMGDKTLAEVRAQLDSGLRVERVIRGAIELARLPGLRLRDGDEIHVRGHAESIRSARKLFGDAHEMDKLVPASNQRLVEIVVTRDSPLVNRHLSAIALLVPGTLMPVGIHRPGRKSIESIDRDEDMLLKVGDILLIQGDRKDIRILSEQPNMLLLERNIHVPRQSKARAAIGIMTVVVFIAAIGVLPISVSALCGVLAMLASRCIAWHEVWASLNVRVLLLIVTSLALGTSLTVTGADRLIAHAFVSLVAGLPPPVILSGLLLLTALLTEIMTNNAVAVIWTPIAVGIARELGMPELPFLLAVLFGANMSFITPIGYQTNLLVFSAGGYQFSDFFRVGIPLQIVLWLAMSAILSWLYL